MSDSKEIGVRIYAEWWEMTKSLRDSNPQKWLRLFSDVTGYGLGYKNKPDYSKDAELQELWERTNIKPRNTKEGWIKVWKRRKQV